jgi:FHS family L-fucose permease-like MFS transporter
MAEFVYFERNKTDFMPSNLTSTTPAGGNTQTGSSIPTNYGALGTLVTVFFFWGFIAAGNSIFIPFCKHYFHLDQFQSQLVDFAFYTAYYLGALGLFIYGAFGGRDLVAKWGYKRSIVYGLLFSALGAAAMIIAVNANTFSGMLVGLFVVALGFSLQQTSAQPFAISLGDPSTATSRVNLGGGINSFGTMVGPILVAVALFGSTAAVTDEKIQSLGLSKVIWLYSAVGVLFIAAAALFFFSKKVPAGISSEKTEKAGKALNILLVITGLLIVMFVPVFSSYKGEDAQKIVTLQQEIKTIEMQAETIIRGSGMKGFAAAKELSQTHRTLDSIGLANTGNGPVTTAADTLKQQFTDIDTRHRSISTIREPLERYRMKWLLGALLVVVAGLLFANRQGSKNPEGWGAMQYPQLVLGMLGIFVYVGVEVAIGSNLSELLKQDAFGGKTSSEAAPYISMYWGSLMIGRWAGAVAAFDLSSRTKQLLTALVPVIAFGVAVGINTLAAYDMTQLYYYIICVLIMITAMMASRQNPVRTLLLFSLLGVAAMTIGIMSTGKVAIYALLSGGLCCSIMWPCIFSLSVAGLGKYTTQGSAFLIMMILGGGIIPPIQGKLADLTGIHASYWVCALCFAYLAFFAFVVKNILSKQGIRFDEPASGSAH